MLRYLSSDIRWSPMFELCVIFTRKTLKQDESGRNSGNSVSEVSPTSTKDRFQKVPSSIEATATLSEREHLSRESSGTHRITVSTSLDRTWKAARNRFEGDRARTRVFQRTRQVARKDNRSLRRRGEPKAAEVRWERAYLEKTTLAARSRCRCRFEIYGLSFQVNDSR